MAPTRRTLAAAALLLILPAAVAAQTSTELAPAQPAPPAGPPLTPEPPPPTWVPKAVAELRALDKITAQVTPLTLRVGDTVRYGSLRIFLRACVARPADAPADSAAFLDITDSHPGAPEFHGWMIVSAPSVAIFQHPVYDVRPAACHD